ncbi:hypothetical protein [Microseira sp. BLCC-F43]
MTVEECVPIKLQLLIEHDGCFMAVKRALTEFFCERSSRKCDRLRK